MTKSFGQRQAADLPAYHDDKLIKKHPQPMAKRIMLEVVAYDEKDSFSIYEVVAQGFGKSDQRAWVPW